MGILDAFIEINQFKRIGNLEEKSKYVDNNSDAIFKHEMLVMGLENKIDLEDGIKDGKLSNRNK